MDTELNKDPVLCQIGFVARQQHALHGFDPIIIYEYKVSKIVSFWKQKINAVLTIFFHVQQKIAFGSQKQGLSQYQAVSIVTRPPTHISYNL